MQIHGIGKDPFFALEGDIDAARDLVETAGPELARAVRLPRRPAPVRRQLAAVIGPDAAALVVQRSQEFLDRVG